MAAIISFINAAELSSTRLYGFHPQDLSIDSGFLIQVE